MTDPRVPALDHQLRQRLARRFGSGIEVWLDELPPVLSALARRWGITFESLVQRGTVSVVLRCRNDDGRAVVLKISPDRGRIAGEAAALARRSTIHVPEVRALDEGVGAMLLEAIEPGTPLDQTEGYPAVESVGSVLEAVQVAATVDDRPLSDRIAHLYRAGLQSYRRRPELAAVVSPELYERGRLLGMRLAGDRVGTVGLHGDLTPANLLDGGEHRGLVAIDPAPCRGALPSIPSTCCCGGPRTPERSVRGQSSSPSASTSAVNASSTGAQPSQR